MGGQKDHKAGDQRCRQRMVDEGEGVFSAMERRESYTALTDADEAARRCCVHGAGQHTCT